MDQKYTGFEVAIVGMSCRFPGADDWRAFWDNLVHARESFKFFSDDELRAAGIDEDLIVSDSFVKAIPALGSKNTFDANFFDYTPDEALMLGPQNRVFHECVWAALEDAGYIPDETKGLVGLYASASSDINWRIYAKMANQNQKVSDFILKHISDKDYLAPMVSYKLNLRGASMNLTSACSSSLVGIHLACRALIFGEVNMAVAGGVFLHTNKQFGYQHEEGSILSRDGHCRAFDKDSSGTVIGEGTGVVVLKRLANAVKDGDHIYAVIKGSAVNNDGERKIGLTAPSVEGQAECIKLAGRFSKVAMNSIDFIETHGTGTSLGDTIEIAALNIAYKELDKAVPVGSVKTNIGHLDTAAGIAGLMKAALSLKYRQLPPSLHFTEANPLINFEDGPFYVNNKLLPLKPNGTPLRAGVSSLGVGGTNAHTILEEAPPITKAVPQDQYKIFTLSAKTKKSLHRYLQKLDAFLAQSPDINLSDAAYTYQIGRKHFSQRLALVATSQEELRERLQAISAGNGIASKKLGSNEVIFMFPGQGAQYQQMGKGLYESEALFRAEMDRGFNWLKENTGTDFKAIVYPEGSPEKDINETRYAQPLIFIFEYALAQLVLSLGIQPQAMIGHSIGEYVAATLSGVFSYEDALRLLVKRGALMFALPKGDMLSVGLSEKEIEKYLGKGVDLATINGPNQCVLSGETSAIDQLIPQLEAAGVPSRKLHTSHAFHSAMLEPMMADFERELRQVKLQVNTQPFISNLTGEFASPQRVSTLEYWVRHMRQAVRFSDGLETLLAENKHAVFLEIGPGRVLSALLRQHRVEGRSPASANLIRPVKKEIADERFFAEGLGQAWALGVTIDWKKYHEGVARRRVPLPTYAFEQIEFPSEVDAMKVIAQSLNGNSMEDQMLNLPDLEYTVEKVERPELSTVYEAPETLSEKQLTGLLEDFFGMENLGVKDDIFELGVDSLKLMTLNKRIQKTFGRELPIQDFYDYPVIKMLVKQIDARAGEDLPKQTLVSIPKVALSDQGYPLSSSQKRIWLASQMEEGSISYNIPLISKLPDYYDAALLKKSFAAVVERHEILRTVFKVDSGKELRQWVLPTEAVELPFYFQDLSNKEGQEEIVQAYMEADAKRVFDLEKDSLLRVALFRLAEKDHVLYVNIHHIISDDWSLKVLSDELLAHYNAYRTESVLNLSTLNIQYKDYAAWQNAQLEGEQFDYHQSYWLDRLSGKLPLMDWPGQQRRPEMKTYLGYSLETYLNTKTSEQLRAFSTAERGSLFMVMLSLWYVLFYKYTGQKDQIYGTPVAGRQHTDLNNQIGCYINTLGLRMEVNPQERFLDFFQRMRGTILEDFNHQIFPFEKICDGLKLSNDSSRNQIFDIMFSFHNSYEFSAIEKISDFDKITGKEEGAKLDMLINAAEFGENIYLYINFNTAIYDQSLVRTLLKDYKRLLATVFDEPTALIADIDYREKMIQNVRKKNIAKLKKIKNK